MLDNIKQLYQCEDETLHRDARYILSAMATELELTGDFTDRFLDDYIQGKMPELASKDCWVCLTSFRTITVLKTTASSSDQRYFHLMRLSNVKVWSLTACISR
jgi:hypothetical protein